MTLIEVLDKKTIDKIAAGEVIERPASVVKELIENSIDAKSSAITVEIKDGGISFIRVTDNGYGIAKDQIKTAFLRHATSKIRQIDDLNKIKSLGFRGEALSSIAAVAQVELITKTASDLTGVRFEIEDSMPVSYEEIGAPSGTTFIVRNLFFHTPARKKFLKSEKTEATYISTLIEHIALSNPDISIQLIINGKVKLKTTGNGNLSDVIYKIYGKQTLDNLLEINESNQYFTLTGFIGKPVIARGNRKSEMFFVNGRYIESKLLSKSLEEGYHLHLMQHQFPFAVLHFEVPQESIDVNVHPTKMQVRFDNPDSIYNSLRICIKNTIENSELINKAFAEKETHLCANNEIKAEPFEIKQIEKMRNIVAENSPYEKKFDDRAAFADIEKPLFEERNVPDKEQFEHKQLNIYDNDNEVKSDNIKQTKDIKLIGQIFDTYLLFECDKVLYIMDQHAAHEKIMFEKLMNQYANKEYLSQMISPPVIINLTFSQFDILEKYLEEFLSLGYEIEKFGGNDISISAVPADIYGINPKNLFIDILDGLSDVTQNRTSDLIVEKIASMSCKAAVKGNQSLSMIESKALLETLFTLDNPYQCPHGRPTMIKVSQYEMDKKFKRIL